MLGCPRTHTAKEKRFAGGKSAGFSCYNRDNLVGRASAGETDSCRTGREGATVLDYSPLFISIKVSLLATVFTFIFGVLAARFVVRLKHCQSIIDGIFTLPMILPPTVVGFFCY